MTIGGNHVRGNQAWRVHTLGAPATALRLDTLPVAEPAPGCARVDVAAVGLNHPDLLLCRGRYQERPELPFSPGYEAAGVVTAVGAGSTYHVGDRVIVIPELPSGALQTVLTVPDAQLFPVPDGMPLDQAAVLHIAYATAYAALHRRAGIRGGETLIVDGAAGGVGLATVQLGHAAGARVIALATGGAKTSVCRAAGADMTVDLAELDEVDQADLAGRLKTLTGGHGGDVIVDVVGGDLFGRLRRATAFEGRLVAVGFTAGDVPMLPVNHALLKNYSLVGLHLALYRGKAPTVLREIHDALLVLYARGAIDPPIDCRMPFTQAPAALELLARREVIGRVVLTV